MHGRSVSSVPGARANQAHGPAWLLIAPACFQVPRFSLVSVLHSQAPLQRTRNARLPVPRRSLISSRNEHKTPDPAGLPPNTSGNNELLATLAQSGVYSLQSGVYSPPSGVYGLQFSFGSGIAEQSLQTRTLHSRLLTPDS